MYLDTFCNYVHYSYSIYIFFNIFLAGFERRRCETTGKWEPEAPSCKETLCKDIVAPSNGTMVLTTLRIGGQATFKCIVSISTFSIILGIISGKPDEL